jgi:hypothetical protein
MINSTGIPLARRRPLSPGAGHIIEPMLGLDDLATILKCSRRWLERARSAGRVPKPDFMAGRCPRWKPSTIRAWIEAGGRR